jgi:outer membrane protein
MKLNLMTRIKLLILFSLLTCINGLTQEPLSAKQAIELGLERNFQIQIAEKNQQIAERNNKWSEAGMFPTVSLNANYANAIQDNTNNPFTFTPGIILNTSIQPSLNLNWNLFAGFNVWITKDRLDKLEQQSEGNAMVIIESTVSDIIKAYYTAVLHQEKLKLLQDLVAFSRKQANYYELKEQYAGASSLESMQFKNQYLNDSINVLLQELSFQNARRKLNLLMNVSLDSSFKLTDPIDFILPEINAEQAKKLLLSNNNNLKNQLINVELAELQTKIQRSFLYPTLTLQAGVQPNYSWVREIQNDLFSANPQTMNYSASVALRYNLFNNWKTKRAVEVSKIQTQIAELRYEEMEQSMSNTLASMLELFNVRNQLVNLSGQNLDYADRLWKLGNERFSLGSINSIDLSSLRNTYINTKLSYLDNLYNRIETFFEIFRLTGNIGLYHSME